LDERLARDQAPPQQRLPVMGCIRRNNSFLVFPVANVHTLQKRHFSSGGGTENTTNTSAPTDASIEETLNKLFAENQNAGGVGDAWYTTAEQAVTDWTPTWYNLADQAIVAVTNMHEITGLEVGWSIVATTICLRLFMFPIMVETQRNSSRMAHVQPELSLLKTRYERIGTPSRQDQLQFSTQMMALFKRYNVKPFRAFLAPIVQMPLFIGMFFGLKKMPEICPDLLKSGGMYWFPDLTVPDPNYILPVMASATFLALVESGREQMTASTPGIKGEIMINVFRLLALFSLPVCISFHSGMLCYWTANNLLTLTQNLLLKQSSVQKFFGIWDMPKPVPGQNVPEDFTKSVQNIVKRMKGQPITEEQKIKQHNAEVEAKKTSFRMARIAREKRRSRGITGTKII
jgi:YidC/Oxa1 family membrane protein insertase